MKYCCDKMQCFIRKKENGVPYDSDDIIDYSPQLDEYGIVVHDSGCSYIIIKYCPWCGKKLPDAKRDLWFEELENMGIENPLEDNIPEQYQSDKWWKQS